MEASTEISDQKKDPTLLNQKTQSAYDEVNYTLSENSMRVRYEPQNSRFKIFEASDKFLEENISVVLQNAAERSRAASTPIKVVMKVPDYNGFREVLLGCEREGHGYTPCIEENKGVGDFIDLDGKVCDGFMISWLPWKESNQLEKKKNKISKALTQGWENDPTNYVESLKNQFYFRSALPADAPSIVELRKNEYLHWCSPDAMTTEGVRKTLRDGGQMVVAQDMNRKNKIVGAIALIPEGGNFHGYTFRYDDMLWASRGLEITDVVLESKYQGKGVAKGMTQYLVWNAFDTARNERRTLPVIFSEALYPWAAESLRNLGFPLGGDSPAQAKSMQYPELTGVAMRHVRIVPRSGLIDGSELTNHAIYRLSV